MSSTTLKWIAIISMIIDHIGVVFFDDIVVLRIIGRLAFPIFAFLIGQGFEHTQNVKKYAIRLGLFALISEIPFNLAFYGESWDMSHQNVFFTLFIGLMCLWMYSSWKEKSRFLSIFGIYVLALFAEIIRTDYGFFGVFLIFMIYQSKTLKGKALVIIVMNALLGWLYVLYGATSSVQIYAGLGAVILLFYNGQKGKGIKYLFYLIYPFHLLVLYFVNQLLVA